MAKADKDARSSRSKRSGRGLRSKAMTAATTGRPPKLSSSLDGLVFTAALRVAQAALFAAKMRNRSKRG